MTGALAAIAASALALTACSGGGDGGDGEKVYVQAISEDPGGFNAQISSGPTPMMFSIQIMDTLIRIDADYELSPGLATDWDLSDDGLTLELELREGVTWHDGEPFTAEDVKFNLEEMIELNSFGAQLAARIDSVDIEGENSVIVNFSQPFGPALEAIAQQFMVPRHIYEGTDYVTNDANVEPTGTGPMMFDSYTSGEEVVLVKNPDYWEGEVQVDRAVYPIMTDPNARATALFAGELDRTDLDPSQQERVAQDEDLELMTEGLFPQLVTVMFNAESEHLSDPEVRRLVFSALDREEIVDTALNGLGTPAQRFFPDAPEWAVNDEIDFDEEFPRDIDAINEGLDEAGFPRDADGTRFTLKVQYISVLSDVAATVELAQSMLEEVGIELELVSSTSPVFTEQVYTESDFDLAFLRSTVGADPSIGIVRWYECNEERNAAANPSGICDDVIDEAAAGALDSTDREVRGEHLRTMQARAAELMYYAPLAWFDGAFPTINTSRWSGADLPTGSTNGPNWLEMELN